MSYNYLYVSTIFIINTLSSTLIFTKYTPFLKPDIFKLILCFPVFVFICIHISIFLHYLTSCFLLLYSYFLPLASNLISSISFFNCITYKVNSSTFCNNLLFIIPRFIPFLVSFADGIPGR